MQMHRGMIQQQRILLQMEVTSLEMIKQEKVFKSAIKMTKNGLFHGKTRGEYMNGINRNGEMFYPTSDLQAFLEHCNKTNTAIYSLEFFSMAGKTIMPNIGLTGIDCIGLYKDEVSHEENVKACNSFVESCVKKSGELLAGKYFCAVLLER